MWNIFPGDKRMFYLKQILKNKKNKNSIEILPIPVSRDKVHICNSNIKIEDFFENLNPNSLVFCGKKSLIPDDILKKHKIYDYSDNETFLLKSAELTSYGVLKIINEKSNRPMNNLKILISGFGRIGKLVSQIFLGLKSKVYVMGHSEKDSFWTDNFGALEFKYQNEQFDFIINTVPEMIFYEENLKNIKSENYIELASYPGVEKKLCEDLNINYISALGIPGKFYPMQAAKIIEESIIKILDKLEGEK